MKKISAIILVGNREKIIENCFKSLKWVNEIVVVDIGCQDKSLSIAKKYQAKIIRGAKEQNFSLWRNQGAKEATGDWLLYVDTDERLPAELIKEIRSKINFDSYEYGGYFISRKNYFLGKEFKSIGPDYQLRLIKKSHLLGWEGIIHENPKVKGKIGKLENPLIHLAYNHQDLEKAVLNTLNWSLLEAKLRYDAGHPPMTGWRFLRVIIGGFWEQFGKRRIWREGTEGIIEGIYQVFSLFFTYFRLWEKQRKKSLAQVYKELDNHFSKNK